MRFSFFKKKSVQSSQNRIEKNDLKGDNEMKHTVELKLPNFLNGMFDKLSPEEKVKFGKVALVGGAALLGITVVYLTGYNRGIKKVIENRGVYIIKTNKD